MRCTTHLSEPGAGVCACCLRERLSALGVSPFKDDTTPSPTICKKPVSSSSKSESFCPWLLSPDFVNRTTAADGFGGGDEKFCTAKSSILTPMRSKRTPKKGESNAIVLKPPASNFSLFARVLRQRIKDKKKSSNVAPAEEDAIRGRSRKPHEPPVNGRGMSPASDDEPEEEGRELPTPSQFRQKVVVTQPPNAQIQQNPCSVSSFTLCLNPMARPIPGNRRIHCPVPTVLSGQIRGTFGRRSAATDASGLMPNRSRKLVDLGKVW